MSSHVILAVAAVALSVAVVLIKRLVRRRSGPRSGAIDDLAAWADGQARADAKQHYQIDLDGSDESVRLVEDILGKISALAHDSQGRLKEGMSGMAMMYGMYIGECIRRNHGGTWGVDHEAGGPKSYPFRHRSDSFPTAWAYRRIVNGAEDNVWMKYRILVIEDRPE